MQITTSLNSKNMKTDTYSKVVLTIIAVCLVVLTLQQTNVIPKAHAAEAHSAGVYDSNFRFDSWGNLKVSIENTPEVELRNTPRVEVSNSYIYVKEY